MHRPERALSQELLESQLESASRCFPLALAPQTMILGASSADEQHLWTYVANTPRKLFIAACTERALNKPLARNHINPSKEPVEVAEAAV